MEEARHSAGMLKNKLQELFKVPGIPLTDIVTIEDLVKNITEALKKEDTSVLDITIAMRYADDLEVNMGVLSRKF